jgi:hypothetical protein
MEIGRIFLEAIEKLINEKRPAVKKIHLSKHAEAEIRNYLTIMYGTSFRSEGENRDDPLKELSGYPVEIHPEPTDKEYWIEAHK